MKIPNLLGVNLGAIHGWITALGRSINPIPQLKSKPTVALLLLAYVVRFHTHTHTHIVLPRIELKVPPPLFSVYSQPAGLHVKLQFQLRSSNDDVHVDDTWDVPNMQAGGWGAMLYALQIRHYSPAMTGQIHTRYGLISLHLNGLHPSSAHQSLVMQTINIRYL